MDGWEDGCKYMGEDVVWVGLGTGVCVCVCVCVCARARACAALTLVMSSESGSKIFSGFKSLRMARRALKLDSCDQFGINRARPSLPPPPPMHDALRMQVSHGMQDVA